MARAMLVAVVALAVGAEAFSHGATMRSSTALQAYVPDGMTAAEYQALKKKETEEQKKKKFGAGGARGFESRSMASFIVAKEAGKAEHLFPVDPAKVRSGEIPLKDVPYMQRGGSWTNSDLQGKKGWMNTGFGMRAFNDGKAKKLEANKFDAMQNKLKPSVGIFGEAGAVDWTGRGARGGDGKVAGGTDLQRRAQKNGISADQQMWRDSGALSREEIQRMNKSRGRGGAPKLQDAGKAPSERKFFGLF